MKWAGSVSIPLCLCVALAVLFTGCGGGGGGGGGSEADRGARLMHASLDDAPLSMKTTLDPARVLQTARFAEVTGFAELPRGAQQLTVEGGQVSLTPSEPFTVVNAEKISLLFYRSVSTDAVETTLIAHPQIELGASQSAIRFIHAAAGAGVIEADLASSQLETRYGSASDYALVPAGAVSYVVKRQVDKRVLVSEPRTLEAGKAYSVLVAGRVGEFIASRLFID